MMKDLLIGANGSEWSRAAVEFGLGWARTSDLAVTFVGIVDVEGLTSGEPVGIGGSGYKAERDAKLLADTRERIESAVADAVARADELGVVRTTRILEGDPAETLGLEAQRHDAMVIGRRAVPVSDHDPAPSATMTDIMRHTARPVVVTSEPPVAAGSVIVAYDGSTQAARALHSFVGSELYADQRVELVGVGKEFEETEEKLNRARDYLALHGREVQLHVLPKGDGVTKTLHAFIQRTPARLLVMGVYGQPYLKELLVGSVTRSMLSTVPLPLFLDH